ncbi:MAG: UDP-N-acetylmuramoyl-tripeptide--D-alanyl-D-alanine ligase [Vibrio sp.]
MKSFSLDQIVDVTQGSLVGTSCSISSVTTDTREVVAGSLFIALIGERFDAHDFAHQAIESQAAALVVSRQLDLDIPQLVVEDTKIALGQIGAWVHHNAHGNTKTLALTGSCGKTTVKEMLANILSRQGKVLATAGNFNNDIGVPLTLLRASSDDDFAVIELGANHIGEIAYTTNLVKPQVALVNNVAAAHLEGFGSIEGVAKAKGEIYQGLEPQQSAVVNLDSNGGELWREILNDKQCVYISKQNPKADFYATDISVDATGCAQFTLQTPNGQAPVQLSIIGEHNIANAVAAAAMAMQVGVELDDITAGLSQAMSVKGRVQVEQLTDTIRLIDDSYNASVPAMKAAADLLANYSGQRWLVLGFMAELGEQSYAMHKEVGEHAAQYQFEHVLTYGDDTKIISELCGGVHFETHQEMQAYIQQHLNSQAQQNHTLLIKGANSSKMSQIVAALQENYA